jgi:iron complex transport system substrate-binding protein
MGSERNIPGRSMRHKKPWLGGQTQKGRMHESRIRAWVAIFSLAVPIFLHGAFPQAQTFTDDAGNVFRLKTPPQRIVSLAPNITEILFALGLGDKIAGVTRYCDYPAEALTRPKIGGLVDPDIEKIKALGPDLIIGFRGNPLPVLKKLQELRLPVFILDIGETLESVSSVIEKIGRITQRENEARALDLSLGEKYRRVVMALASAVAKPKVFLSLQGSELWTCGKESYFHDLIARAKGTNVAGYVRQKWFDFSRERLIQDDPEIIIVLAKSENDFSESRDWFKSQPEFRTVRAVKENRILFLDENIASRFGPRLYDAFAALARIIHPECFP